MIGKHFVSLSPASAVNTPDEEEKVYFGGCGCSPPLSLCFCREEHPIRRGKHISKGTGGRALSRDERVKRATERLRELQASGVLLSELLGGEAGAAFIREDCDGDSDVATAAFALVHSLTEVHSPTVRDEED